MEQTIGCWHLIHTNNKIYKPGEEFFLPFFMLPLTKKTYFAYAIQMYDNPSCSGIAEFQEDLLKIKYIKRLLNRYVRTGQISARLLLNHVIGVYNVFQPHAVSQLLFFRIAPETYSSLKTILECVNLMPEELLMSTGTFLLNKDIPRDDVLWAKLQETLES